MKDNGKQLELGGRDRAGYNQCVIGTVPTHTHTHTSTKTNTEVYEGAQMGVSLV